MSKQSKWRVSNSVECKMWWYAVCCTIRNGRSLYFCSTHVNLLLSARIIHSHRAHWSLYSLTSTRRFLMIRVTRFGKILTLVSRLTKFWVLILAFKRHEEAESDTDKSRHLSIKTSATTTAAIRSTISTLDARLMCVLSPKRRYSWPMLEIRGAWPVLTVKLCHWVSTISPMIGMRRGGSSRLEATFLKAESMKL